MALAVPVITRTALESLAAVVAGSVSAGKLHGSYQGFAVEAWPAKGRPHVEATDPSDYDTGPEARTFVVKLGGVPGARYWNCRSFPAGVAANAAGLLAYWGLSRLVYPRMAKEFRFGSGAAGKWLGKKLGVPTAEDPALSQRLRAAGLLEALSLLRWGPNPYLPKTRFSPGLNAVLDDPRQPPGGELVVEVQMVRARVPGVSQFQDLLAQVTRIAQLNAEVNTVRRTDGGN